MKFLTPDERRRIREQAIKDLADKKISRQEYDEIDKSVGSSSSQEGFSRASHTSS